MGTYADAGKAFLELALQAKRIRTQFFQAE